jgi:tetratricopeptide (TPR) repeat protein
MKIKLLFIIIFAIFSSKAFAQKVVAAPFVGNTLDGTACDGDPVGYGPFDYSKRHLISEKDLFIVEHAHFTPKVENLIKGQSGYIVGDLEYTLRAWPNHHRALLSIIRYKLQLTQKIRRKEYKEELVYPECNLQRAINFSKNDPVPYALYGYYLYKLGHLDKAEAFYKKATELDPDNVKFHYSYGLVLVDLKRYDDAKIQADIVYKQKNTPDGLKNMLIKAGHWSSEQLNDSPSQENDKGSDEKD